MSTMQSGALAALGTGEAQVVMEPGTWSAVSTAAPAAQASASKAGVTGVRHICRGISVSLAAAGTAQTPIQAVLRDGATGVGTILWSKTLAVPIGQSVSVDLVSLAIVGTAGNAMTLEFAAAAATGVVQDVTLTGVDPKN